MEGCDVAKVRAVLDSIVEWCGNGDGLMIEDVIEWREGLEAAFATAAVAPVDASLGDWRLVKIGEVAPLHGGHGSWVETDHPAVVACMGSAPECIAGGCQSRRKA